MKPCGKQAVEPARSARMAFFAGTCFALAGVLLVAGCASPSAPEAGLRASSGDARRRYEAADAAEANPPFDGTATLDDYLRRAFSHNSGLRAAFDRWQAALERIPQARALDDPTLSFEYFIEQMDSRYQVSLTQVFPAFGKRALRESRAAAEAEAAMHAFEAERVTLFDRVVKAFYAYDYLFRATRVTDENLRLLADLEQVVTIRYKAGLAPFSDLIKTQVEKDRLENERGTLRDERASRSAVLAALLNLPVHDVLPWPKAPPSGPAILEVGVLDELLADLNPDLKAAESMIAAERYRKKLARKRFLPDVMLGASWMVAPGMGGSGDESDVSLMAGITVPIWWGQYRAEIREAEAMIRAASNERDEMQNNLKAELGMAIFKFRDAERRIGLFATSLVPKATQALEVAKQEFSTGKADFMTLIDAQRTHLEFRLMLERATADREIALGEIGCCIGRYDVGIGRDASPPAERR
jgi:outer membrane protein TolC